jgi:hypothetical protein
MSQEPTAQETGAIYTLVAPQSESLTIATTPAPGANYGQWAIVADANIASEAVSAGTTEWVGRSSSFMIVTGTKDANTTARTLIARTPTGSSGFVINNGFRYRAQARVRTPSTTAPGQGIQITLYWYKSDGTASATASSTGTATVLAADRETLLTFDAVAPSDARFVSMAVESKSATSSQVMTFYVDDVSLKHIARAVFNDPTDADYVCGLSGDDAVTGLDSPEVRESFADLAEADGAIHGNFFHGRRPITISGTIVADTTTQRAERMSKVTHACNAMTSDATLTWTPSGSIEQQVFVRKQQPTRFSGAGWAKQFFAAFVAADPYIYGTTLREYNAVSLASSSATAAAGSQQVQNRGNADAPFEVLRIRRSSGTSITGIEVRYGSDSGPIVVALTGLSLTTAGAFIEINTRNRTVTQSNGTNQYSAVNFTTSTWAGIPHGYSTVYITLTGTGTPVGTADIAHYDTWI